MGWSKEADSAAELRRAVSRLSQRYRDGDIPYLRTSLDRRAYLLTRFPATQSVMRVVFQEVSYLQPKTILDIGAGPATSWDPICQTWGDLVCATFVEPDSQFASMGCSVTPPSQVQWVRKLPSTSPLHDVVLFSYSWGEIDCFSVLQTAWNSTKTALIVIEPGTPKGFERVLKARSYCVQRGGQVVAPCPHSSRCPLDCGDSLCSTWCHFAVRLERNREHRLAKGADLGYEDEKFSYVVIKKPLLKDLPPTGSSFHRVVRSPSKRKGHIVVTLCTQQGIEERVYSKEEALYKSIKKLKWGDLL